MYEEKDFKEYADYIKECSNEIFRKFKKKRLEFRLRKTLKFLYKCESVWHYIV